MRRLRELGRVHLERAIQARPEFGDPRAVDIEGHRGPHPAERCGEREADIADADDGHGLAKSHHPADFSLPPTRCQMTYHRPSRGRWAVARDPSAALLAVILLVTVSFGVLVMLGRVHGVAIIACLAFALRALRGVDVQLSGYASDAAQYDYFGQELARYWQHVGPDPGAWLGKDGFPTVLAIIYTILGHAPEVGYLVNALAGGLTVLVVAAIVAQMGWLPAIKPAAWLVALWPVGVLWGGLLLREAIVTLLLAVGLWGTVRLYKQHYLPGIAAVLAAGILMVPMRGGSRSSFSSACP